MKVFISRLAEEDVLSHIEWLNQLNPKIAKSATDAIVTCLKRIELYPEVGHKEREYRKLPVVGTDYVIYYRIKQDMVDIARVLHSKQKRPC